MYYVKNEGLDPFVNQALEEYLFSLGIEEDIVYLWRNEPAVVFGCYQNPFAEINLPRMWEEGVKIVRRITGGGTVYHDPGNVNYTMISTTEQATMNYDDYLTPMIRALRDLGFPVEKKNSCDIYMKDAKISGSAQKMSAKRILHHGTLLYHCDLDALRRSASGKAGTYIAKGVKSRPAHVGNLTDILQTAEEVSRIDVIAFQDALLQKLLPEGAKELKISEEAWEHIRKLAKEKYQSWQWTYGSCPSHTYEATLAQGLQIAYRQEKGKIVEASVRCEGHEVSTLSEALVGLPLEEEVLRAFCEEHLAEGAYNSML